MYLHSINNERDFVFEAISNRTMRNTKNMYPYIILQYKAPIGSVKSGPDFEICMRHDALRDKRIHCPSLHIYCSQNCVLTTDNGERDKPFTRLTRKMVRPNRIIKFQVSKKAEGIAYIGFFGEGVKYIDYLSLYHSMTIESKYIAECTRLESLIISPTSSIENFSTADIADTIQYLKIDGDMYKAKDGRLDNLVKAKNLRTLYLVGYGYTGSIKTLISMSNLKNAYVVAPNVDDMKTLKKEDFPNAIQYDSGPYWVSLMRR